jgi:hypothetical protein
LKDLLQTILTTYFLRVGLAPGFRIDKCREIKGKSFISKFLLFVFRSSRTSTFEFNSTASCSRSPRRRAGRAACPGDLRMDAAAQAAVGRRSSYDSGFPERAMSVLALIAFLRRPSGDQLHAAGYDSPACVF